MLYVLYVLGFSLAWYGYGLEAMVGHHEEYYQHHTDTYFEFGQISRLLGQISRLFGQISRLFGHNIEDFKKKYVVCVAYLHVRT